MADEPFQICDITAIEPDAPEPMGTKDKFWLRHKTLGLCLFKEARSNTGEDWAEKVAEICCELLGLPHARVELAVCGERQGILTPYFLPDNSLLIHGNEILARFDEKYPVAPRTRWTARVTLEKRARWAVASISARPRPAGGNPP